MIPEKEYERYILEFGRDLVLVKQVVERMEGVYKRLRDDFYENK